MVSSTPNIGSVKKSIDDTARNICRVLSEMSVVYYLTPHNRSQLDGNYH
jgi:hypothetical protein